MLYKNWFKYGLVFLLAGGVVASGSAYYEDFNDWNSHGQSPTDSWAVNYFEDTSDVSDTNGWTVLGNPGTGIDLVGGGYGASATANDGNWIDLAGSPGPGGIQRNIALIQGLTYNLSFSGFSNDNSGFDVIVNGKTLGSYSADDLSGSWTSFSVSFTATSSTSLEFVTSDPSNGNVGLDSVSVQPAPEPVTMVLIGGVLAASIKRKLNR